MENMSIPSSANIQQLSGSAAPQTEVQHAQTKLQRIAGAQEAQQAPLDTRDQEQARFSAVKKAAHRIVSTNPLSPSLARFTIYRDTTAEGLVFVTRFTNIADGKVTTIRDGELLTQFSQEQGTLLNGVI